MAKRWYKYTDESGKCWRIETIAELAEIGGLELTDAVSHPLLPKTIKPRYIWITESERPKDRLRSSVKVILERDQLGEIYGKPIRWDVAGKEMLYRSYYGEVVSAE